MLNGRQPRAWRLPLLSKVVLEDDWPASIGNVIDDPRANRESGAKTSDEGRCRHLRPSKQLSNEAGNGVATHHPATAA